MPRKKNNIEELNEEVLEETPEQAEATPEEEPKVEPIAEPIIERPMSKLERTKAALAKQPRVRIIIPKEASETDGAFETVQINGYLIQIKKGVYVDVPEQVAKIITDSRNETEEAHRIAQEKVRDEDRMEFNNS